MRRKSARRWWLDPTPVVVVPAALGLLMAACASLHNTPAQDLAWDRWTACHGQIRNGPALPEPLSEIRPKGAG